MGDRVLRALASALAKGNGKVKVRYGRRWEGGGDNGAGTVDNGKEGGSGSEDGSDWRNADEGDASGRGIGTVIGRSVTVVADTEGRREGGRGGILSRLSSGEVRNVLMEGHIGQSNILAPIGEVHTVAF